MKYDYQYFHKNLLINQSLRYSAYKNKTEYDIFLFQLKTEAIYEFAEIDWRLFIEKIFDKFYINLSYKESDRYGLVAFSDNLFHSELKIKVLYYLQQNMSDLCSQSASLKPLVEALEKECARLISEVINDTTPVQNCGIFCEMPPVNLAEYLFSPTLFTEKTPTTKFFEEYPRRGSVRRPVDPFWKHLADAGRYDGETDELREQALLKAHELFDTERYISPADLSDADLEHLLKTRVEISHMLVGASGNRVFDCIETALNEMLQQIVRKYGRPNEHANELLHKLKSYREMGKIYEHCTDNLMDRCSDAYAEYFGKLAFLYSEAIEYDRSVLVREDIILSNWDGEAQMYNGSSLFYTGEVWRALKDSPVRHCINLLDEIEEAKKIAKQMGYRYELNPEDVLPVISIWDGRSKSSEEVRITNITPATIAPSVQQLPKKRDYSAAVEWVRAQRAAGNDYYAENHNNRTRMCRQLSDIFGWEVNQDSYRKAEQRFD